MICVNIKTGKLLSCTHITDYNIVIHPTNSCYGFGACIDDEEAYKKIYDIKGRSVQKPFFITVPTLEGIHNIGVFDDRIYSYLGKYPNTVFTFILERSPKLPKFINPGFTTIGVQISSGVLKKVCEYLGGPIFGTSANISGQDAIYKSEDIKNTFGKYGDILFLDAGDLKYSEPSTIIDLTRKKPKILRGTL